MNEFEESLELYDSEHTKCLREALEDFKNYMGRIFKDTPLVAEIVAEKLNKICVESFRLGFYNGIDFSEKFM